MTFIRNENLRPYFKTSVDNEITPDQAAINEFEQAMNFEDTEHHEDSVHLSGGNEFSQASEHHASAQQPLHPLQVQADFNAPWYSSNAETKSIFRSNKDRST